MKIIKLTIDTDNNIAYIYLDENNEVANTIELGNMNIDLSKEGTIIGIEFLNAKEQINIDNFKFVFQDINTMAKPIEYPVAG